MPLTIISGAQLRSLLYSLDRDQVVSIQQSLGNALRDYSVGNQDSGCAATLQPRRTAVTRLCGRTTLFMPSSTRHAIGMKVISLQDKGGTPGCEVETGDDLRGLKRLTSGDPGSRDSVTSLSSEVSDLSFSSQEDSTERSSSTSSDSDPLPSASVDNQPIETGLSKTMGAWPAAGSRDTSPQGSVTLLDDNSLPFGLINAEELTPFRTALTSTMIFNKRKRVRTIVVFGAGKQAYWHIRLALILRREDIKRVFIVNRSFERAAELLQEIYAPDNSSWRGDVKFSAVSSEFGEYQRILADAINKADAIFCCTPSHDPLFPAELLTSREGRRKGRLVIAIGSYKPHMAELHPDILREEVAVRPPHRHFHKHVHRSGVIVVDSLDAAMKEAGELIKADIKPHQVVEIGELLMVKDVAKDLSGAEDDQKQLREWVERGNVIFKGVGLGLMDLVTGSDLVELARARKIGTTVEEF
ncbi:putative proline utilization protein PrnX-like [Aspergillus lucknowensis]|uniref:Proline utilization protein PrnX-like protein n=1 Tax=Aspergillus lucknowensis TaxID=176173 RepID=A0ABR4LWK4_9EURO